MLNQAMHCPKPGSLSSRAMEWLHHFLEPPPRSSGFREERRHLPREPLQLEVCITPQNGRPFRTHTTNVSYNGLFVKLDRAPPPPGSILRLRFEPGSSPGPFEELVAVVTRTIPGETPGIGMEIIEGITPPKALLRFHALLSHHQQAA